MPVTEEFIKNVSNNVSNLLQFIKENFILENEGINMKATKFYEEYELFCMRNKIQHPIKKGNTIFLCQYLVPGLVQND
jgi:hypothetical protein